jgi:hypothetical protein
VHLSSDYLLKASVLVIGMNAFRESGGGGRYAARNFTVKFTVTFLVSVTATSKALKEAILWHD